MKTSKLVLAALALGLVPYEVETGKDGEFTYKSLLVNLSSKKDAEGKMNLEINLFNVPDFLKKTPKGEAAEAEAPAAEEAPEEAPVEPAAEEAPAEPAAETADAPEAPAAETVPESPETPAEPEQ